MNTFTKEPPYLVFDIGGTNMRIGLSIDGKTISQNRIVPTPQVYDEGLNLFSKLADELLVGKNCNICVGGIAGSLTSDKSHIYNSPHLGDWSSKPLKEDIEKILGCPACLENDTSLVGLGEASEGSGRGFRIVSYVTVSTGVNGARIVDGKIDLSVYGFEIGHQIIDFDKSFGNDTLNRGELEELVSGSAISKHLGMSPLEVNDGQLWDEQAKFLSIGLYNMVLHWSPEIIILGGSLMKKIPLEKTRNYLKNLLTIFPDMPRIERSALGELGGFQGGLIYISSLGK